jgi:pimeloyl-ACP methyl ester carboxylesterase
VGVPTAWWRSVLEIDPIDPPSPLLLALESRAWLELVALLPAWPVLSRAPRGDGHPVMVMPGWLAGDTSTRALRWYLRDRGYHAHAWRLGMNRGPTPEVIAGLGERLHALHARHGRKVSLVGWSLGGIYARELARRLPEMVRQVITLASPFRDPTATSVQRLYRLGIIRPPRTPDPEAEVRRRLRLPLSVPSTALYTKTDGIVAWQSCIDDPGPTHENVAIRASHCGIGHHPASMMVIADRLAQPEGTWRPYQPPMLDWLLGVSRPERPVVEPAVETPTVAA